jgi:hypothetical protein
MNEKSHKDMSIEELETSDYLRGDVTFGDKVLVVLGFIASISVVIALPVAFYFSL